MRRPLLWRSPPEVSAALTPGSFRLPPLNWGAERFGCYYRESRCTEAELQDRGSATMTASKDPTKKKPKEAQQEEVRTENTGQTHVYSRALSRGQPVVLCGWTLDALPWCWRSYRILIIDWNIVEVFKNTIKSRKITCNSGIFRRKWWFFFLRFYVHIRFCT